MNVSLEPAGGVLTSRKENIHTKHVQARGGREKEREKERTQP